MSALDRNQRPDSIGIAVRHHRNPHPGIDPVEQLAEYALGLEGAMRGNFLSHSVWDGYDAIVEACCDAWNKLMKLPERIASITRRTWATAVSG